MILFGDMNRHVGKLVEGNDNINISYGGCQIKDLVETNYTLVNATDKVIGGPYTRYEPSDPKNTDKKSVLSLCIISNSLLGYIESLVIDDAMNFTPYRVLSDSNVVYTDHYSLLLKMKDIPVSSVHKKVSSHSTRWNTNKEGGWSTYENLTAENKVLDSVLDICDDSARIEKNSKE